MRAFYALTLPSLIQEHCSYIINSLKDRHEFKHIRWTKPENMHITLRFHAKIEKTQLEELNNLLAQSLSQIEPVDLSTRRLLLFPPKKPHILVLAIHLNEALGQLVRMINEIHSTLNISLEKRPFLAHITLGRSHDLIEQDTFILDSVKTIDAKATQVVLFHSQPTETGSFYKPLQTFPLKSMA